MYNTMQLLWIKDKIVLGTNSCLSVRLVSADYVVHQDFIGMYDCPNTDSESITLTIKGTLHRCGLDIGDMRGQTYDGASVPQGQMSGVAKHIEDINPKAVLVIAPSKQALKQVKKAPGLQAMMTQFSVFLGLKVSLKLFSSVEECRCSRDTTQVRSTEAFRSIGCPKSSH